MSEHPSIPRTTIGNGLEITRIVTGLWQVSGGHGTIEPEDAVDHMQRLCASGLTSFDMADHYGPAEELTGALIERLGDESGVQASTKWCPEPGDMTPEVVRGAIERSLSRMKSKSIDLLQFHWWDYLDPRYIDAMMELASLQQKGLITNLGLTNFDTAHLRILLSLGVPIASNQVHFSLLDSRPQHRMTPLCLEHGIKLLCYGTLSGGFLSERWLGQAEPDESATSGNWSLMKYLRFIKAAGGWEVFQHLLSVVAEIARRHEVSVANVAVRWVLQQPAVAAVLVGSRLGLSDHTEDNRRLFSFELDDEDLRSIEAARSELSPIPGDCGDEYRKPPFLTAAGDLSDHKTKSWRPELCERHPVGEAGRVSYGSGTVWEDIASYSRAVRVGNKIEVSGTTATHGSRLVGSGDPVAQAEFCIDKIEAAVEALGGRLSDVVRTRVYVPNTELHWEDVARVHGRRFADIEPANTLVGAALVGKEHLVEIEAEAIVTE